jgi:hypothetical protein
VPDFKLPDGSDQLAEVLQQAFVPPKGSRLTASDLFEIFKDPERAWKKENLEWTGQKLIMHPVFRIRVAETRSGPVYDEELYNFLARLSVPLERSAETESFEMPRERLEWARYEYRERALQKSISDQEDELRDLVARQKELKESLGFRREALERHIAERPEPKRTE